MYLLFIFLLQIYRNIIFKYFQFHYFLWSHTSRLISLLMKQTFKFTWISFYYQQSYATYEYCMIILKLKKQYDFIWYWLHVYIFLSRIYIFKIIFINEYQCVRVRVYVCIMIHNNIIRKYDNLIKFSKLDISELDIKNYYLIVLKNTLCKKYAK